LYEPARSNRWLADWLAPRRKVEVVNDLSSNSIRCGWSSAFTHRTVEPAFTVISAGLKAFLAIVMVLSDTDAVRGGVMSDTGRVRVRAGTGVARAVVGTIVGCAGGDSEHPQVRMKRETMKRSTGIFLIDAGRSFPYNKMVVMPGPGRLVPVSRWRVRKVLRWEKYAGNR
jgi:hypothetical protein